MMWCVLALMVSAQMWFNPLAVYNFLKGCPKK